MTKTYFKNILKLKPYLLPAFITIFFSACANVVNVPLANSYDSIRVQLENQKMVQVEVKEPMFSIPKLNSSLHKLQHNTFIDFSEASHRVCVDSVIKHKNYLSCNKFYFLKNPDTFQAEGSVVMGVRFDRSIKSTHDYGWYNYRRKGVENPYSNWESIIENSFKNQEATLVIYVYGVSTKQKITTSVPYDYSRWIYMKIGETLKGKLKPDSEGFVIKGSAIIPIPDTYLPKGITDKSIVIPLKLGKTINKKGRKFDPATYAYSDTKRKCSISNLCSSKFNTAYGLIDGFKLIPNVEKYTGLENSIRKNIIVQKNKQKRLEVAKHNKLVKNKKYIVGTINNKKLAKPYNKYVDIQDTYNILNDSSYSLDRLDCRREIHQSNRSLISSCESKQRRLQRKMDSKLEKLQATLKRYKNEFLSRVGKDKAKALNALLEYNATKNRVTYYTVVKKYPYANVDWIDRLSGDSDRATTESNDTFRREQKARSSSKMFSDVGKPSLATQIMNQNMNNLRAYDRNRIKMANEEREREAKQKYQRQRNSSNVYLIKKQVINNNYAESEKTVSSKKKTTSFDTSRCNSPVYSLPTFRSNYGEKHPSAKSTEYIQNKCSNTSPIMIDYMNRPIKHTKTQTILSGGSFCCAKARSKSGNSSYEQ
ncbi:MAG: hypothetical protein GQ570_08890 [Helicobacteraceae bacterium]|nr:hypothetical protein [Helicobacteraceae bacterium]